MRLLMLGLTLTTGFLGMTSGKAFAFYSGEEGAGASSEEHVHAQLLGHSNQDSQQELPSFVEQQLLLAQQELDALRQRDEELAQVVRGLQGELDLLKLELAAIRPTAQTAAQLDATDSGYGVVQSHIGPIAFSIVEINAANGGAILRLAIGNMSVATIKGMRLNIEYRPKKLARVAGDSRENDASFPIADTAILTTRVRERIVSGSWHVHSIELPKVSPQQIEAITVSAFPEAISLGD